MSTIVIFRKWSNGNVIALFPYIPSDNGGYHCLSYEHVGQHGGASPQIVQGTKPATETEYKALKTELELLGYADIEVRKIFPSNAFEIRKANLPQS